MVEEPSRLNTVRSRGEGIRTFPGAPRWPYILPALIALLFVGHAAEDGGGGAALLYLGVVGLCIVQAIWPTFVGWALLFAPLLAYAIAVALNPDSGPRSEWVLFMSLGFVPAFALWLGRPSAWRRKRSTSLSDERREGA
jgi:hypothetical protein